MTTVESEFDKNNFHYIIVRIDTACCKRLFTVYVDGKEYFDVEYGQHCLWGTRDSINMALKMYRKEKENDKRSRVG